jgi:hypothetical protein
MRHHERTLALPIIPIADAKPPALCREFPIAFANSPNEIAQHPMVVAHFPAGIPQHRTRAWPELRPNQELRTADSAPSERVNHRWYPVRRRTAASEAQGGPHVWIAVLVGSSRWLTG